MHCPTSASDASGPEGVLKFMPGAMAAGNEVCKPRSVKNAPSHGAFASGPNGASELLQAVYVHCAPMHRAKTSAQLSWHALPGCNALRERLEPCFRDSETALGMRASRWRSDKLEAQAPGELSRVAGACCLQGDCVRAVITHSRRRVPPVGTCAAARGISHLPPTQQTRIAFAADEAVMRSHNTSSCP